MKLKRVELRKIVSNEVKVNLKEVCEESKRNSHLDHIFSFWTEGLEGLSFCLCRRECCRPLGTNTEKRAHARIPRYLELLRESDRKVSRCSLCHCNRCNTPVYCRGPLTTTHEERGYGRPVHASESSCYAPRIRSYMLPSFFFGFQICYCKSRCRKKISRFFRSCCNIN